MLEPKKTKTHSRIVRPRRNPIWAKIAFYFLLLVFLGAIVYLLFFSGKLSITSIQVNGAKNISSSDIVSETEAQLAGKYLKFFAKSNILLVRDGKIQEDLAGHFRLIENVAVKKKFPNTLLIHIFERTPTLAVSTPDCFMLDENGTAYDQADPNAETFKNQNLIRLSVQSGLNVALGQKNVLDKGYMNYILFIKPRLKSDFNLDVSSDFQTPNPMAEEADVKTQQGWMIYFSTAIPLDKELQMLQAVLGSQINSDQRKDLEYVDLRIDNKVYYKLKNSDTNTEVDQNGSQNNTNPTDQPINTGTNNKDKKKKK
ncbi:MAG: FtsQ-type POTRA domain-containing protein [Candidatus Pacebacteria bacterium]|nr:FtsQ-type POTRA domain-containing protein [Candidatus Paceibacterota bacterium]MDR3583316.1 FtsQ-type POTRA domain-containing protein [Candidatus Paceibacterota bacterium]